MSWLVPFVKEATHLSPLSPCLSTNEAPLLRLDWNAAVAIAGPNGASPILLNVPALKMAMNLIFNLNLLALNTRT